VLKDNIGLKFASVSTFRNRLRAMVSRSYATFMAQKTNWSTTARQKKWWICQVNFIFDKKIRILSNVKEIRIEICLCKSRRKRLQGNSIKHLRNFHS